MVDWDQEPAPILANPIYERMQFFPFRNRLLQQERIEKRKQDRIEDVYNDVTQFYKGIVVNNLSKDILVQSLETDLDKPMELLPGEYDNLKKKQKTMR